MSKSNVFGPDNGPAPDFLRNTYDKSFQCLITTDIGENRVCFCKETLPGDSWDIKPVVAIRSHPIVFPIQTRIKFYCHFFYGRNRILFDQWEDFIFNTKDVTLPWLKLNNTRAKKMISTGSLGDNLGIPSTLGKYQNRAFNVISFSQPLWVLNRPFSVTTDSQFVIDSFFIVGKQFRYPHDTNSRLDNFAMSLDYDANSYFSFVYSDLIENPLYFGSFKFFQFSFSTINSELISLSKTSFFVAVLDSNDFVLYREQCTSTLTADYIQYNVSDDFKNFISSLNSSYRIIIGFATSLLDGSFSTSLIDESTTYSWPYYLSSVGDSVPILDNINIRLESNFMVDATDDSVIDTNPFVGDTPVIPINALPFRLYEFISNYYYRLDTNNPYILDGEPQYNKFIPTVSGGEDNNEYLISHRNWEFDAFTTAVTSPQFGVAPLVGLTYSGGETAEVHFDVTDSDSNTKTLSVKVGIDDEGYIKSILDADEGVPSGNLRQLMEGINHRGSNLGISINTLRNVNSFQRFLENMIRRGLRYRNQLLSHFGVSVDFPDIDIPQFIGGFSGDLTVRQVTNMAESAEVALGDVAGMIDAVIQSNHSIDIYTPEHGFIMGIFSIVPVPTYSQTLHPMFTRYTALDYFQKEFDKIGYVPIFHKNVAPLQAEDPDAVFGYQRAWWEYMQSLDEVHGDFRTTLSDFVLYRQFLSVPSLNEEFLKVDSESLNNIFSVDKVEEKYHNSAKFLCQFYFEVSHKTMIPKHGVARIE